MQGVEVGTYSFCASMITRVEFATVALEGATPTSWKKDFASDMLLC
jgi:hypothetical protein